MNSNAVYRPASQGGVKTKLDRRVDAKQPVLHGARLRSKISAPHLLFMSEELPPSKPFACDMLANVAEGDEEDEEESSSNSVDDETRIELRRKAARLGRTNCASNHGSTRRSAPPACAAHVHP